MKDGKKDSLKLSFQHRQYGLLHFGWTILFFWMLFHFTTWMPYWIPIVVYTVLCILWIVAAIGFFNDKCRLLVFKDDGKVEWKFEK